MHPAMLDDDALLRETDLTRGKSSGPGGQHRNKVQTTVHLVHRPTGVSAQAGERREPQVNLKKALSRLRINLALEVRTGVDVEPSERWRARVKDGKLSLNPRHHDFPAMLAEALDMVIDSRLDLAKSARRLDITTSQLLKLLRHEPRALEQVNQARQKRKLRPLK